MTTADPVRTGEATDVAGVERHSIDYIPASERHGSPRSLFTLWFAANMQLTTVVTGALAIILGLDFLWAIVAIVVGNLIGGIFMAYHSAQGPKLGIPQMIQSRAQFGFYGAILPLVLVLLMYLGYFASSAVLGGQAMQGTFHLSVTAGILIVAAICTVLAVYGYDLIHRYESIASVIFFIVFLFIIINMLITHNIGALFATTSFSFSTFLLVVSITATWQITYAPYVADYSRYLPQNTSIASTFWFTYAGSVIATVWMMILGAIAAAVGGKAFGANSTAYVAGQAGHGLQTLVYVVIILGIIAANVLNLYGFFMSITTTVSALVRFHFGTRERIGFVLVAAIIGSLLAIAGQGNFLTNYSNFLLVLLYFLIPWTAINLVDFYLVRHEHYDIRSIFDPTGIYGAFNWRALGAYVVAVILEVPFINQTDYEGPLAKALNGADIAWIVGLIVSGGLYYVLMRGQASLPAPAESGVPAGVGD